MAPNILLLLITASVLFAQPTVFNVTARAYAVLALIHSMSSIMKLIPVQVIVVLTTVSHAVLMVLHA